MRIKDAYFSLKSYFFMLWKSHKGCAICCSFALFFAGAFIGSLIVSQYTLKNCQNKIMKIENIKDLHIKGQFTTVTFN